MNDFLQSAKPFWKTFSYDTLTKMSEGDVIASQNWNGYGWRARQIVPTIKFVFPKEGIDGLMDNVSVLKGAVNVENAKAFQNFIMYPENAAMISNFARYDNGILGSHAFLDAGFKDAPEINPLASAPQPEFVPPCSPEVVEIYNKIRTKLKG